jgi:hypothetical protein
MGISIVASIKEIIKKENSKYPVYSIYPWQITNLV